MAHHHENIEEAKPFRLTGSYVKTFAGMIVIGLLLLFGGYGITKIGGDHEGHSTESHGTEEQEEDHGHGDSEHHSDAGGLMQFASHENDGGHEEAHEGDHEDDHNRVKENGTWLRAYVHPSQTEMIVDGKVFQNGAHHHPDNVSQFGSSLLAGTFWWLCVALFGVFFIAVGYAANAGWYVMFKRILEPFYRFLPIGGLVLVAIFFAFGESVWDWRFYELNQLDDGGNRVMVDTLIDGKTAFLNVMFILVTGVLIISIWTFFGHMLRKQSLLEEKNGGLKHHSTSRKIATGFLPVFGLGFSLLCFEWIMSVDPHWFSTIYAVYCFAGLFVSGASITALIAMHLKEKGHLPGLTLAHTHDLGKFIFAFSVFWGYIWLSQFLLIWYANIPEETFYYIVRFEDYNFLFTLNVVLNFIFPFLAMMSRKSKQDHLSLRGIIRVILIGRMVDVFLLIAPGVLGSTWGVGDLIMTAGVIVMWGGVFLYIVFKGFSETSLEVKNHPFYEESLHHNTGV